MQRCKTSFDLKESTMVIKKYIFSFCCFMVLWGAADSYALTRTTTTKQSAIQNGTTVRTKIEATGLYDQDCYNAYFGCMDQFCITDNSNGGSCGCSDDIIEYEKEFSEIQDILDEANRIATVEVERVKAGANADIVFTGERRYDENGNIIEEGELSEAEKKEQEKASLLALFETNIFDDEDDFFDSGSVTNIASLTGADLYSAADNLCYAQVPDSCMGDIEFLRQLYLRQITSDCLGFKNLLTQKRSEAELEMANAESAVRNAIQESFDEANKYDLGQCLVEFKKCMQTQDACGDNWENCVSTIALENMQNNEAVSTAGTKVQTTEKYDITASTMEILESKRTICEHVLDQCVVVRDMVWPSFLREAAPTIKVAELQAESKFRQSCLTNISNCIQTACRDDIAGKGIATMDACLSRPDMARSFCKVEIDPCERMEPLIWGYVEDKLAAMRVDACTQEVKDCFTADTRCGPNFENCIGMDYDYIHDICPIDSLVVCKANNPNFSMDDLDSMLMGLYLNIDNAFIDQCQNLVDQKMAEICGSTTDCNRFAADDTIGTGSLRSQKDGTTYRITGMISFGSIKMGNASGTTVDRGESGTTKLGPGEIGVQEYLAKVKEMNVGVDNAEGIISSIEEELNNIAGTINRTIEMIEQDPEIQFCVNGRDLSQITGKSGESTTGRFPNLLNQVKMQIAVAALRQAQDNYNEKLNSEIAEATRNASVDLAQYMCQKMAETGSYSSSSLSPMSVEATLAEPYAISYDVALGLNLEDLSKGGVSQSTSLDNSVQKDVTSTFDRENRICHVCTTITTKNCDRSYRIMKGKLKSEDCEVSVNGPVCEDISM